MIKAKKTILIIEDDADTLRLIKDTLEDNYFLCETASTAVEGLEKAQQVKPQLILLDLMLPGMSGFGFIRQLKSTPQLRRTPVVILSSLSDGEIANESLQLGAVGYLTKAINQKELISTIRDYTLT